MQGTPAGLPCGIPGIGLVMDGAMQQAPQPDRQATVDSDATAAVAEWAAGIAGLSSRVADRRQPA
jgi:hypothetical protein